jgi:hypothetical protein
MARLHAGLLPNVVLAIDAAYAEFVNRNDYEPGIALVNRASNAMLRTFSKIYACRAASRPGLLPAGDRRRAEPSAAVQRRAPTLAAGAAVEDVAALARARPTMTSGCPGFPSGCRRSASVTPSVGNFVLARFPDEPRHNADAAFAFLQSRGILTRQMGGYGLPECLRINRHHRMEPRRRWPTSGRFMSGKPSTVALIGIGLIGSSWRECCGGMPGADRRLRLHRRDLDAVRRLDLADETTDDLAAAADGADLVVLATLSSYREIAMRIAPGLRKGAIVTDVGSVKEQVIRDAAADAGRVHFARSSGRRHGILPRIGFANCSATAGVS